MARLKLDALKMLQQTLSLPFLMFFLIFPFLTVSATNSAIYAKCSQLCFTSMTPYESNLNSLFTSIVDSASTSNFNTYEVSPLGSSQSEVVYGLFQCRGDVSSSYCRECMASSVSQLKKTCPMAIGGTIQLEGCFMKYDNMSFFGAEDKTEMWKRCGTSIGYNSNVLNRIDAALTYLIVENKQYFYGGRYESVQGVVQCVQDLSLSECQDCLLEARGRLRSECETSTSGDMYLGKCYIRYVDQEFQHNAGKRYHHHPSVVPLHVNGNDASDYNFDYNDDGHHDEEKKSKRSVKTQTWFFISVGGGILGGIIFTVAVMIYKSEKVNLGNSYKACGYVDDIPFIRFESLRAHFVARLSLIRPHFQFQIAKDVV
ncbi:hypothetical protein OSB04_018300 [Centaurea solstitialis]|uniref:Gnk2-homologous domain-containing protein n=1 Tax=Centaurea solstitialis TaxID=347529 RepID=A0AA38WJ72_9ASTR|nr:hypothetical protein OSB04_018300 [Centaurea solstitialis]